MFRIKRRRTLIRLLSFTLTAFAISVGFAGVGYYMAYGLRMNIEYSYQRALSDLSDHLNNIDVALQKGLYAGTSSQLIGIAGQIWTESGAAKTDLSQIQISNVNLDNTTKFVTQVGDYANMLSKGLAENLKVTDQQRSTLKNLQVNAGKLSLQLSDLNADIQAGRLTLFKSSGAVGNIAQSKNAAVPTVATSFQSIENNMSGMPSLIYDGPFSDNMLKKMPELTKGKPQVSKDSASGIAARFLGRGTVTDGGQTGGNLPTYNFKSGNITINVSKAGGYVVRYLDSRSVTASKLNAAAAAQKARAFLTSHGITAVTETYYLTNNNVCNINYAYTQQGVTCYTDLVKVGVALDNGSIVTYDSTGYIMNHKSRSFKAPAISGNYAQSLLSPELTVQKASLALIPTSGVGEDFCYEFKCVSKDGKKVIDYINCASGVEEQLLILLDTPGGTLAM